MALQSLFPQATTVGNAGLFSDPSTSGLVQGTAYGDPSTMWRLRGGVLNSTETLPMWGGVGVYADVPGGTGNPLASLGPIVGRATALTGSKPLLGFSVFTQAYAMVTAPNSTAPQAQPGMSVNYFPLGSLARMVVQCDPVLASLQGGALNAAVAWDYVNQMLIPFSGSIAVGTGNTYNSTTGVVTLNLASSPGISPGDSITVASLAGSGSFAQANGPFTAGAGTTGTVLKYTIATGLTLAINDSTGTVTTGPAIPVQVLDIQTSNCVTVAFTAATGATNWAFSGACAVIQI